MKNRVASWLMVFAAAWGIVLVFSSLEYRPAGRFRLLTAPAAAKAELRRRVSDWPETPRLAALRALERYGAPDSVSDRVAAWKDRGPWRSIDVYRDLAPRGGVVEQTVAFTAVPGVWQDLSALKMNVLYDPRHGLLSSSAASEEENILALNVAAEVLEGRRPIGQAAEFYERTLQLARAGKESPYTRRLLFKTGTPRRSPWSWDQPVY